VIKKLTRTHFHKISTLDQYEKKVMETDVPVIVVGVNKKTGLEVVDKVKKEMFKTKGKFKVAQIDISKNHEVAEILACTSAPSIYLFYKGRPI
jgi:thioredoxin-like negative regulator of GroEL